ncbi:MAG: radical SAM protein [Proteobacteria bacterium]|nr:radical SAM protein [Pseudomonadota bacterium]
MRFNRFWPYRRMLLSGRFVGALWRSRRNIVATNRGRPPASGPYMAELDVTYRCNCQCQMCQRWQDLRKEELTLEEYERLARVFRHLGVHQISIAGGEPLLREDIFAILTSFARGMSVNLCTNGILLESNADQLVRTRISCVTVSLDGATSRPHDSVRGAPGSFQQVERGIYALVASSRRTRPLVRVRMTVSDRNIDEVRRYYEKWKEAVDDVLLQPAHFCRDAFYTGLSEGSFGIDPHRLARQLDGTPFRRDGYMRGLLRSLQRNGGFPHHRCYAGVLMVRFDPWGNVFPCLEQHTRVGSIREHDFETIWNSDAFHKVRREIGSTRNCTCWYNNTALISHYANALFRTTGRGLHAGYGNLTGEIPKAV